MKLLDGTDAYLHMHGRGVLSRRHSYSCGSGSKALRLLRSWSHKPHLLGYILRLDIPASFDSLYARYGRRYEMSYGKNVNVYDSINKSYTCILLMLSLFLSTRSVDAWVGRYPPVMQRINTEPCVKGCGGCRTFHGI